MRALFFVSSFLFGRVKEWRFAHQLVFISLYSVINFVVFI